MGGMYMDLDIRCKRPLPNVPYILGGTYADNKINNNVIRIPIKDAEKLVQYSVDSYNRIKKENLFTKMPGRRLLNSLGASMFARFCRENKITSDISFRKYFYDEAARSWVGGKDAIVPKGYIGKKYDKGLPP